MLKSQVGKRGACNQDQSHHLALVLWCSSMCDMHLCLVLDCLPTQDSKQTNKGKINSLRLATTQPVKLHRLQQSKDGSTKLKEL